MFHLWNTGTKNSHSDINRLYYTSSFDYARDTQVEKTSLQVIKTGFLPMQIFGLIYCQAEAVGKFLEVIALVI